MNSIAIQENFANGSNEPSFYDVMDRKASEKAGKVMMNAFQVKWKQNHKNGGVTPYTHDLYHAILSSVPATMEDMKENQPELYDQCMEHGEFFCFTTVPTLIQKMNRTHDFKDLQAAKKTVYNQIKRLIEIGIITEKVNYVCTGSRNPYPSEQNDRGRGKIQLWISSQALKINAFYEASAASDSDLFSSDLEKRLPQYRTSSLLNKNKELKLIDNTPPTVDKAVSPVGEINPSDIHGKEQRSKPKTAKAQNIAPENLKKNEVSKQIIENLRHEGIKNVSKNEFSRQKLWDLARYNLYDNAQYNEEVNKQCKELIGGLLEVASNHVESYRKGKIKQYVLNPAYLVAKNKDKALKKFAEGLPSLERCTLEIVAHAIIKQRKYSEKRNGLQNLYHPTKYFTSFAALQALNYSIDDWSRIQENYFQKNKASQAYFEQVLWMNNHFSNTVERIQKDGHQVAKNDLMMQYKKRVRELQQSPYLNEHQLKELYNQFIHKFKPLFNENINSNEKGQKS